MTHNQPSSAYFGVQLASLHLEFLYNKFSIPLNCAQYPASVFRFIKLSSSQLDQHSLCQVNLSSTTVPYISEPHKMVAFSQLVSAISMALFATTAVASPTLMAARQPPPTSSVIDFTLYKTTQPGYEDQCWNGVDIVHVSPNDLFAKNGADITGCNTADFYVLHIDSQAPGYNCQSTSSHPYFLK
jgi:hypothetical protein